MRTVASGNGARAKHRRSGDPGLWVRNKEQWTDSSSVMYNKAVGKESALNL